MKYPLLAVLSNRGQLQFEQNIDLFDKYKSKKSTIDLWVVNHPIQYADVDKCHRLFLMYNRVNDITKATENNITEGTQVIYVPNHLLSNPDILNPEILFGFVTSVRKRTAFCRFYDKNNLQSLRTISCSEQVNINTNLFLLNTRTRSFVNQWIRTIHKSERDIQKMHRESRWITIRR